MSKYVYPAVFVKEDSGLYFVNFPDFEACFTQGSDIDDALYMAQDILSITLCDMEDENLQIPRASAPKEIETGEDSFVSLVCADTTEYRKTYSGKSVKKNLTIPQWLNDAALRENINFSKVLQEALMVKLHLK